MALHPRTIFAALVVVASALPAGCAAPGPERMRSERQFGSGKLTGPEIQAQVWTFADRFVSSLSQACDEVAESATTPAARREANRLKLNTAHAAWAIAATRSPIAALLDMIVMVRLQAETVEAYWNPKVFDGRAGALVAILQKADTDLTKIAENVLDAQDLKTLADLIDEWRAENPDQVYVTHVRFSNFAWSMLDEPAGAKKGSGGLLGLFLLDPLAGLDPATREIEQSRLLAERLFYYITRLQSLLAWQVEQVYNDLISEPSTQQALQDIHAFTGASERFAASTEDLPQRLGSVLSSERESAVEQIRDALATERAGLVRELQAQEPVLRGLLLETRAALEAGTVLANSISATAETVASLRPSAASPEAEPFDLRAYEAAAAQTTQAAVQLNELVTSLQGLAASGDLEKSITELDSALNRAESGGRRMLNHAFLLAAGIVVLIFAASMARLAAARKLGAQR